MLGSIFGGYGDVEGREGKGVWIERISHVSSKAILYFMVRTMGSRTSSVSLAMYEDMEETITIFAERLRCQVRKDLLRACVRAKDQTYWSWRMK